MKDDGSAIQRHRPSATAKPQAVDVTEPCKPAKSATHLPGPDVRTGRHILVVDESDESRQAIEQALLHWGYRPQATACHSEAWRILQEPTAPQFVILSRPVADANRAGLCPQIRHLQQEYVYVIFLAREGRSEDLSEATAHGADACIRRPVDLDELFVRVRAGERILDLQTQLLAAQDSLREQATHDALTGLWNRAAILETLAAEVDRARREHTPLAVIMADLDHFKNVNDTHGHGAGDVVLRETASRMRQVLRTYDMIGRYGGEEFLIVVPQCDLTISACTAERLRLAVAGEPVVTEQTSLYVTASFGIAAASALEDPHGDALIQAADVALYAAKRAGRNRVELAPVAQAVS